MEEDGGAGGRALAAAGLRVELHRAARSAASHSSMIGPSLGNAAQRVVDHILHEPCPHPGRHPLVVPVVLAEECLLLHVARALLAAAVGERLRILGLLEAARSREQRVEALDVLMGIIADLRAEPPPPTAPPGDTG